MKKLKSVIWFNLLFINIWGLNSSEYYKVEDDDGFSFQSALQSSEQDIQLEDFFWTGSGDGPRYIQRPIIAMSDSSDRDTFIKTATILATVYIDDTQEMNADPLCVFDCNNHETGIDKYTPTDRRFWLLTIISGFFGPEDFPLLEDKLAKLYRIAFMRQQARHLGIVNKTNAHQQQYQIDDEITTQISQYNYRKKRSVYYTRRRRRKRNSQIYQNLTNITKIYKEKGKMTKKDLNKVDIVIHNVTILTETELKKAENEIDSNLLRNLSLFSNQSEIIYTVFVGGKPILATTAADDMRYVTQEEVSQVIEQMVFLKAEPYLKEPQATPLIPANSSNRSYWIKMLSENPLLFILMCAAIFLLILLLMGILLVTTSKRVPKDKKSIARETLMEVSQAGEGGIVRAEEVDVGVTNMGFLKGEEHLVKSKDGKIKSPIIHFPPPPNGSRPTSSSSSTSDSSIYYNRNRMKLSENNYGTNNHNLSSIKDDNVYQMIANKKEMKKREKQHKGHRRKYMMENRVGSIEDPKLQTTSDSDIFDPPVHLSPPGQYETNEAFNPDVQRGTHYHKNKLLLDQNFSETTYGRIGRPRDYGPSSGLSDGVEAINKELLRALQNKTDRSSNDSGSIGSFLSMASVKSFPRCGVPEPLSRVLEPVSVTHLDHYDADFDSTKNSKHVGFGDESQFQRSSSDGADPGVIGPVVWEIHKQEMEKKIVMITSPNRDPVSTRNRFEGLLEGAIKMYSNGQEDREIEDPNDKSMETPRIRDFRGKSAPKPKNAGNLSRNGSGTTRPVTAGHFTISSTHSTQPPSPANKPAWGSGAPSPLVRPMSAGPFHRPLAPAIDVTRVMAPQNPDNERTILSTAPLIQAIQDELKKFNKK